MIGKLALVVFTAAVWWSPQGQEPQRPPAPPAGAAPLRPVEEPYVEPVPRSDLPERFGLRDPIEGFWKLRERAVGGMPLNAGRGYLAIGRRHLLAQFQAPGSDPDRVLLRAGAYTWSRVDDAGTVKMVTAIGHFNDDDGDVHVEPAGNPELRRFDLHDGSLRIYQDNGSWLDFARVE